MYVHAIEVEAQEKKAENVVQPKSGKNARKNQARRQKRAERRILEKILNGSPEFIQKVEMRLPPEGIFDEGKVLSQKEREGVGKRLRKIDPPVAQVNEMFVATEKEFADIERVEKLREKIVAEYTGTLFLEKLPPNPGPRGDYGMAYIPLKDNAQPTWQRPFGMQGVKRKNTKKLLMIG